MSTLPYNSSLNGPKRLPTLETQTVAFVEAARALQSPLPSAQDLRVSGFAAYLRYWRNYEVGSEVLGEVLVLANIEIPSRCKRRGWFWRYCQLCCALVEDGVIIESVLNERLLEALLRRPAFEAFGSRNFLLRKRGWGDWPLSIPLVAIDPLGPRKRSDA